jgi:hypothetical protein
VELHHPFFLEFADAPTRETKKADGEQDKAEGDPSVLLVTNQGYCAVVTALSEATVVKATRTTSSTTFCGSTLQILLAAATLSTREAHFPSCQILRDNRDRLVKSESQPVG